MSVSRALLVCLALVVIVAAAGAVPSPVGGQSPRVDPLTFPGELLLRFRSSTSVAAVEQARAELAARRLHTYPNGAEHWRLGKGVSTEAAIERLRRNPHVLYAEPNYRVSIAAEPNDPSFAQLWGLRNTGQTGGTPDADIDADLVWDIISGSPGIVVGVLDTGVDRNHPDLYSVVVAEQCFCEGDPYGGCCPNGLDEQSGIGAAADDNFHGHGTHVSGTIGAVGNNDIGVVGVNWSAHILALKILDAAGYGSVADAAKAVDFATTYGVHLTSNSWGGYVAFSQTLYDAIARADAAGIAFVAAAGNGMDGMGTNNDQRPFYPASFTLPNIISVAATDHNDLKPEWSNYGLASVHLGAPGVDILSTIPGGLYGPLSGTSMATPHVAGVAAILKAMYPEIPVSTLKSIILSSVDPVADLTTRTVSGGRLNAYCAVERLSFVEPDGDQDGVGDACDDCPLLADPSQPDIDKDGVGDVCDNCVHFNPSQADSDGDGLPDGCDNCAEDSNVGQEDGDTDGVGDVCDNCVHFNPSQADSDGDGLPDGCDNCAGTYNPDQMDGDADGAGDSCDVCALGSDPGQEDADGDDVGDICDTCPTVYNPSQDYEDLDGLGIGSDNCLCVYNPNQGDVDGDGDGTACDNCPMDYNPSQANTDGDPKGNACDSCPNTYNPVGPGTFADTDGDGLGDLCDDCDETYNPDQMDGDADGSGDICDVCPFVPDPAQANGDGDAVGDACDTCPAVYNPDQDDDDLDGHGFGCDNCLVVYNPDQLDIDNDGDGTACDNCPTTYNPTQANADGDVRGDACDNCPSTYNPFAPGTFADSDGDGVGNLCDNCPAVYNPAQDFVGDPNVQVIWPNGGQVLVINDTVNIQWSATDTCGGVSSVDLLLSRNGVNGTYDPIAPTGIANTGAYPWTVTGPKTNGNSAFIKVVARDPAGNTGQDTSDFGFTISKLVPAGCSGCTPSYCRGENERCTHTGSCGPQGCCNYSCQSDPTCTQADPCPQNPCGGC